MYIYCHEKHVNVPGMVYLGQWGTQTRGEEAVSVVGGLGPDGPQPPAEGRGSKSLSAPGSEGGGYNLLAHLTHECGQESLCIFLQLLNQQNVSLCCACMVKLVNLVVSFRLFRLLFFCESRTFFLHLLCWGLLSILCYFGLLLNFLQGAIAFLATLHSFHN